MKEPHDLDAERCVLGALMLRPEGYLEVRDRLSVGDFFRHAHGLVYGAMGTLHEKRVPIDLMTVKDVLEREGSLDTVKVAYLSQLTDGVPRSTNILHYSNVVIDYASKRRLREVCRTTLDATTESSSSSEEIATSLVEQARDCVRMSGGGGESLASALQSMVSSLDDKAPKFSTGLTSLDRLDVCFRPGEFILLAGRPSHGKTALSLHMARAAADQDLSVLFASLEMTKDALSMRLLSSDSKVPFGSLRSGKLSQTEYQHISESMERLSKLPMIIDDHAGIDLVDLRRALVGKNSLLIVDYLQLIRPPTRGQNRSTEVGAISRGLKAIAHDLKIPVLALCQLNRQVEQSGGEPHTAHLRDSGELEQDADVIIFVSRPHLFDESELTDRCVVKVAKHRNGDLGRIELVFDGATQRFRERGSGDTQPKKESSDSKRMKGW